MSKNNKEAEIVANAIYDWHNRQVLSGFTIGLIVSINCNHIQQLSHFAKQGVKVRLK